MRPACFLVFSVAAVSACSPGSETSGATGPGITSVSASLDTSGSSMGDTGSTSAANSTSGGGGSTSGTNSTSGTGSTSSASTRTIYDLGMGADLGTGKPPGCEDKIDFLFVMQRTSQLPETQEKLIAAFPAFIETIQEKFAGFDVHILVTDTDWYWGIQDCEPQGCLNTDNNGCKIGDKFFIPDYPCGVYSELMKDKCNITLGAGVLFNAGIDAANVPCKLDDDRRYMDQNQSNLTATFACMAKVGTSGGARVGRAIVQAVSPELNMDGGCNAGFVRDDALLMITFVATFGDDISEGTPQEWVEAVFAAKHGNKDAVIMLGIVGVPNDPPDAPILKLISLFPLSVREYITAESYGPAFAKAVDLVDEACEGFTPPG